MKIEVEVSMSDKSKIIEEVEAKTIKEAHQAMHKKYKGSYRATVINKVQN